MSNPYEQGRPPQPGPRPQPPQDFRTGFQPSGHQQGGDRQPQGQQGYGNPDPYYQPQQVQPGYYDQQAPQTPGQYQHPTNAPVSLPPNKKRKKWPWIVLAVLAVLILAFAGCMSALSSAVDSLPSTGIVSGPTTVVYSLEGDGEAQTVTFSNDSNGSISQESSVSLPWTKEVSFEGSFSVPVLTGQRSSGNGGTLTCKITDKATGKVLAESNASGAYAVASCSGGLQ